MSNQPDRLSVAIPQLAVAAILAALLISACGSSRSMPPPPNLPPPALADLFFVASLSGDVVGFSDSSGHLVPLSGSAARFAFPLFALAVDPNGAFLATLSGSPLGVASLQTATISAGGKLTPATNTASVVSGNGITASPQGIIAVSDSNDAVIHLFSLQGGQLISGASMIAGPLPQDLVFSSDGKFLYVGDNANGTISVFSIASASSTQLIQTAQLPVAPGEFAPSLVRLRISDAGDKIAATTFDGLLFVAAINPATHLISNAIEIHVASPANLEEVVFDPTGQTVYTADQDTGRIFGFRLANGTATVISGFPIDTLPGLPGLAVNSSGRRVYAVLSGLSAVITFARDPQSGALTSTGETVSSGGLLGGRIVRVPRH